MKSPCWLGMLCLFLSVQLSFAQDEHLPSPSVASQMRFESSPVDYYTGTPQISIPIYKLPTRNKDVNVNLGIAYHPSSVATYALNSGDCGRGWSMFTGGVISRTVRGLIPDEVDWRMHNKGNDLFTFNFMGYTGKFVMDGYNSSDILTAKIKENNDKQFKIEVGYTPATRKVTSFTIFDDKGYKYVFSESDTYNYEKNVQKMDASWQYIYDENEDEVFEVVDFTCRSAYHLTEIYDNNDNLLAEFDYLLGYDDDSPDRPASFKKCTRIIVPGFGKIMLSFMGLITASSYDGMRLTEVAVYDNYNNPVRKFEFEYDIIQQTGSQQYASLKAVRESDFNETSVQSYQLFYRTNAGPLAGVPGTDAWGYRNSVPEECNDETTLKVADNASTLGVLEKMVLPTGGAIIYDFEPNTFSYDVDRPLDAQYNSTTQQWNTSSTFYTNQGEARNSHNFEKTYFASGTVSKAYSQQSTVATFTIPSAPGTDYIKFDAEQYIGSSFNPNYQTQLHYPNFKLYNSNDVLLHTFTGGLGFNPSDNSCKGIQWAFSAGTYKIRLDAPQLISGQSASGNFTITTYAQVPSGEVKKWWFGGGIRIKTIGYFTENDVPQSFYTAPHSYTKEPVKEINFDYTQFNDPSRSSGTILADGPPSNVFGYARQYETVTYANVTVTETGNGRTEYNYYTQIDHPLTTYEHDDRVGKVKNIRVFDEAGNLQREVINTYNFSTLNFGVDFGGFNIGSPTADKTITRMYYPSGVVETTDQYEYYNYLKLKQRERTTGSTGEVLKTEYEYDMNNSPGHINRMEPKVVRTYRDNILLSKSDIGYYNGWSGNASYLPQTIKAAKGTATPETRMNITKYDQYGHVQEFKPENGVETVYIWGYNDTQIIAKIEGLAYSSINSTNLNNARTASNGTNESTLLTALNTLRTSVDSASGMITTYTYKPLIGISTITDPRGNKVTYEYDVDNRLKAVKDKDGNILSENEYHTRPLLP